MKKLRLLSLVVLLVALAANGMVTHQPSTHARCDSVPAPNNLCSGSVDTGCDLYCSVYSSGCADFYNVQGSCGPLGACVCTGIPIF